MKNSTCLKLFKLLKSKNINYVIIFNFFTIMMINWFKKMQKSSKKNCIFWRENKILLFFWAIIFLICWFLKSMWILFFSYCLIISEQISALKKIFQHLLNFLKMFNRFSDIFVVIIIFLFDKIIIYFINLIFF